MGNWKFALFCYFHSCSRNDCAVNNNKFRFKLCCILFCCLSEGFYISAWYAKMHYVNLFWWRPLIELFHNLFANIKSVNIEFPAFSYNLK